MRASAYMLLSCLCFSLMSAGARYLAKDMDIHPNYVIFLRNLIALIMILPWCYRHREEIVITPQKKPLMLRACLGAIGMMFWYNAIAEGSFAQVTAIGFAAPLLATLLAIILLGERVSYRRWGALCIGFIGVAIILGTDIFVPGAADKGALLALGTALVWAFVALLLKHLSSSASIAVILFYMMGVMTLASLPLGYIYYTPLSWQSIMIAACMCIAAIFWQYWMLLAYRLTSVAALQPFEFSKLLFAVCIGVVLFHEPIEIRTVTGGMIIIGSALYITYRDKITAKNSSDAVRY